MKERKDITSRFFDAGDGFIVEAEYSVNENGEDVVEFWLYHKEYGIKDLMFGLPKKYKEFDIYDVCAANLEQYKESYREEYMDY